MHLFAAVGLFTEVQNFWINNHCGVKGHTRLEPGEWWMSKWAPNDTDTSGIPRGNLSDFMKLPLEPKKAPTTVFIYAVILPNTCKQTLLNQWSSPPLSAGLLCLPSSYSCMVHTAGHMLLLLHTGVESQNILLESYWTRGSFRLQYSSSGDSSKTVRNISRKLFFSVWLESCVGESCSGQASHAKCGFV